MTCSTMIRSNLELFQWDLIEQTVGEFKLPAATKNIQLYLKLPGDVSGDGQAHKLPSEVKSQNILELYGIGTDDGLA